MENNEVVYLYLDDIIPNRFQPREVFDDQALKELAISIKEHGVIQPIIVRKVENKYEIIAGERRYKASTMAGLTKIPAIIKNLDDKESSKVALIENLQRRDLTPIEEARTYQKILELEDGMTQEQLAHTLMPLGGYNKDWVRQKAEELGLGVAHKPDSQEICFVEDDDYAKFITDYSGYKPKEGDILDVNGNVIGRHRGLIYYTIGQRKGIGAYGRPMFVMKIDAENNTITLGEKGMEFSNELTAYDVNFVSGEFPKENMLITAKVRYQAPPAAAMLCPQKDGTVKLMFPEPQRAVTPGQAVVFYDGDIVLGGGTVL